MELEYEYADGAAVPEAVKTFYKETKEGDKTVWRLNAKGVVAKATHEEFRNNNINLQRTNDTLMEQLQPFLDNKVDVEEYKRLLSIKGQLDSKQLIQLDKMEEVITERTNAMKKDLETKLGDALDGLKQRDAELSRVKIDQQVALELAKHNVESWAVEDLIRRARDKFILEDGKVVAYTTDETGKRVKDYSSKNGGAPTIAEWAAELPTTSPGYFKKSQGGGASNDKGGGNDDYTGWGNPWKKGTPEFNLGRQASIQKKDPALAKRLMSQAGV